MKKTIFTLFVLVSSLGAFAQFNQGTMLVGGSFGLDFDTNKSKFDGTTSTNSKTTTFTFDPQVGYFFIDNLAAGAGLGVSLSSTKDNDDKDDKYSETEFTFNPFVRYYLDQGIFFQGVFAVGSAKYKEEFDGDSEETKYGVSGWSLSAGYAHFLNDNIAIEPQLGYGSMGYKNNDTDVKGISQGLFIRVGLQIYLRK